MIHNILKSALFRLRLKSAAGIAAAFGVIAFSALFPQAKSNAAAASAVIAADKIVPRLYLCSHNVQMPVTYIETAGGNFYAVLQVEGKQISMAREAVTAGSDAEKVSSDAALQAKQQKYYYLSLDEQESYRLYPEGNKARLSFLEADDSATEEIIYNMCVISEKE